MEVGIVGVVRGVGIVRVVRGVGEALGILSLTQRAQRHGGF